MGAAGINSRHSTAPVAEVSARIPKVALWGIFQLRYAKMLRIHLQPVNEGMRTFLLGNKIFGVRNEF
jgi:hypothetical protein